MKKIASPFFLMILLLVVTFATYFNAIHMDFIGDDLGRVVYEGQLSKSLSQALTTVLPDRPVLTASLWANFQAGGLQPWGYKVVSLLLHALVGFLLGRVALQIYPRLKNWPWIPVFISIAMIVHPLNNQAVNSIAQRGVLLAAVFSLLSFLFYLRRSGEWKDTAFSILFAILAVLSKSNAMALPILFAAYEAIVQRETLKSAAKKTSIYLLVWIPPLIYYSVLQVNPQTDALPWDTYFVIQWRVVLTYFKLFIFPHPLHFLYTFDVPALLRSPWTWLAGGVHVGLISMIVRLGRGKRRELAFALTGMYILLLPESSFFAIRHLAFEHRAYLPFAFFLMAVAIALPEILERISISTRKVMVLLGSGLLVLLAVFNLNYNSKIKTYRQWFEYNSRVNSEDLAFNIYNLNEFLESDRIYAAAQAQRLALRYPQDSTYSTYVKMAEYPEMESQNRKLVLREVFQFLTSGATIHPEARLKMIRFYGRSIQEFMTDVDYWENVDDFIFLQIDQLRPLGLGATSVYVIYKGNLIRLAEHYLRTPSKNPSKVIRTFLALKYFFGLQDPAADLFLQKMKDQHPAEFSLLLRIFETQKVLPTADTRII